MPAWLVALACWLLPSAVVIGCYVLSSGRGQVPACFPFLEGCTSISAAGRQVPAIYWFRGIMLPATTLLVAYWLVMRSWLGSLGVRGPVRPWITGLGVVGALFLVLYAVFLGTEGRAYELMRRYGVTVYFAFTALAQMLTAARLHRLAGPAREAAGPLAARLMLGFVAAMLVLGLVNIPAANFFEADRVENVVEWNFALLMHGWFGLSILPWRRAGLRISIVRD
jgi:hypothetical protein